MLSIWTAKLSAVPLDALCDSLAVIHSSVAVLRSNTSDAHVSHSVGRTIFLRSRLCSSIASYEGLTSYHLLHFRSSSSYYHFVVGSVISTFDICAPIFVAFIMSLIQCQPNSL